MALEAPLGEGYVGLVLCDTSQGRDKCDETYGQHLEKCEADRRAEAPKARVKDADRHTDNYIDGNSPIRKLIKIHLLVCIVIKPL